jgi:broad specificity phosphatase PhoE
MGSITLARHGEPALSRKVRLSAAGYRDWWARYELGGLKEGQSPPQGLVEAARQAGAIVVSTRRRAIETAQALTQERELQLDDALIEAPLPPPPFPDWIKFSPRQWGVIARTWWWFFNHHEGQETRAQAELRADAVALELAKRAATGQDVLVLAHGFFNTMVGRSLKRLGWRCTLDQGFQYWSARRFEMVR